MRHKALQLIFASIKALLRKLDPYAFLPLENYENKLIGIHIHNVITLTLHIQNKDLVLRSSDSIQAIDQYDCLIQGSLAAFLDIIFKYKMFVPGQGVSLVGETHLAQAFFNCFRHIDPDWESMLEQHFPTSLVTLLSLLSKNINSEFDLWRKNRKANLRAFLQDETQCLPSKDLVLQFEEQISDLMKKFEHLDAKLSKVMQQNIPSTL